MSLEEICDRIRQDYANFPHHQSYDLYADDVFFADPLNRFQGVDQYRSMVGFIARWFQNPELDLHALKITAADKFQTHWTLRWVAPVPWQPSMAIPGWTEYCLNESSDKIVRHVDHWHCSRLAVLGQLFQFRHPPSS